MNRSKIQRYERYSFSASPWVQDLTQRDLAKLLGKTKDQLESIINEKEKWIKRKTISIGGKERNLTLPVGKLRSIHERLKYHLNKIRQPSYLFSPRKGYSQRDNAEFHVGQIQFLSLDIKQFYPSTTSEHIFRWAHYVAGLKADVSGMLAHLVCIDGKMPFGSPVSPILMTLVHREMFDKIYKICCDNNLKMSLWVDDITISGQFVRGELVEQIRSIIRKCGFQTHKIKFRSSGRPIIITGVPIMNSRVRAPRSLHERIKSGYNELYRSQTDLERIQAIDNLLSALGTYRYHIGAATTEGRKAANRMHALRSRREKLNISYTTYPDTILTAHHQNMTNDNSDEAPWL